MIRQKTPLVEQRVSVCIVPGVTTDAAVPTAHLCYATGRARVVCIVHLFMIARALGQLAVRVRGQRAGGRRRTRRVPHAAGCQKRRQTQGCQHGASRLFRAYGPASNCVCKIELETAAKCCISGLKARNSRLVVRTNDTVLDD